MSISPFYHLACSRAWRAHRAPAGILILLLLSVLGPASAQAQRATYASPQVAVDALIAALGSGSTNDIVKVLGAEGRTLASSGDPVADKAARERFEAAYKEAHEIRRDGDARATLVIGKAEFPFPIPLVADRGAWHFDTAAGAEEILVRRIGENELAAIAVMRAYVDAQREYADADRDGKGAQYARLLLSSQGKKDGLYWPTGEGEPESPLGPLIAEARATGYSRRSDGPTPYHGYVFSILTAQGKDAPGGPRDYIVSGRMIGGFGLIATPAEYGSSGVMTFIVNHDGMVFQKDLGPNTERVAATIRTFNPDPLWTSVLRN